MQERAIKLCLRNHFSQQFLEIFLCGETNDTEVIGRVPPVSLNTTNLVERFLYLGFQLCVASFNARHQDDISLPAHTLHLRDVAWRGIC